MLTRRTVDLRRPPSAPRRAGIPYPPEKARRVALTGGVSSTQLATLERVTRGLTGRLLAVSAIVLLLCAGTFALVLHNVNQVRGAVRDLRVSNQRITTGKDLLKLVVDLETGMRGYVVTHDPKFLEPTIAGQRAIPGAEQDFLAANAGDPRQAALARQIVAGGRRVRALAEPIRSPARAGTSARPRSTSPHGEGKRRVDALRRRFATLETREIDRPRPPARERRLGIQPRRGARRRRDAARLPARDPADGVARARRLPADPARRRPPPGASRRATSTPAWPRTARAEVGTLGPVVQRDGRVAAAHARGAREPQLRARGAGPRARTRGRRARAREGAHRDVPRGGGRALRRGGAPPPRPGRPRRAARRLAGRRRRALPGRPDRARPRAHALGGRRARPRAAAPDVHGRAPACPPARRPSAARSRPPTARPACASARSARRSRSATSCTCRSSAASGRSAS